MAISYLIIYLFISDNKQQYNLNLQIQVLNKLHIAMFLLQEYNETVWPLFESHEICVSGS